jgi:hypothetical protein
MPPNPKKFGRDLARGSSFSPAGPNCFACIRITPIPGPGWDCQADPPLLPGPLWWRHWVWSPQVAAFTIGSR